ncbi:threonine synthase [Sulfodiicoccus acidiphilus]|uniref:Threonine synthase n=1 Tax=Sulfodiicoccus acidiphilus TaxID=1670455 RepID=A0A348B3B9_9CREN|nr:threonine synthase [Sulfodiicoccus acidiphilus]GGT95583.1 threonine synthase [Sulfodiicoccus acidiphilus]
MSLEEGNTPLIKTSTFGGNFLAKFEGANPTGSFKDRGMSVAVSNASNLGYRAVMAASTGNTAASAAAYAARAGMRSFIILPKGKIALGKLAQSVLYGAEVIEVEGNFDEGLEAVLNVHKTNGTVYPLNSFNPWRLEGQKTLAFEVVESVGVPDTVVVPVGNAGNIYAIWKGFVELTQVGLTERVPRMIGVQAEGASPIARAVLEGREIPEFTESPETIASAIRIGKPVNWPRAMRAIRESNGTAVVVTDEEILLAQTEMARREGLGVEPASAATLAGYVKLLKLGVVSKEELVVGVFTGHSLKDPDSMMRAGTRRFLVPPSEVLKLVEGELRVGR